MLRLQIIVHIQLIPVQWASTINLFSDYEKKKKKKNEIK